MKSVTKPIATFSLVARDAATGDLGIAVASKFLAVGAYVPTASSAAGAVASQSFVNTTFGYRALHMMAEGATPDACAEAFRLSDARIESRQFGIVSRDGASVTFTGRECHPWAGGKAGHNYAAQGNILAGPEVVSALAETYLESTVPFPERLLFALAAADEAGGDRRGRQSAALLVVGDQKGYGGLTDRWIDLRADDHEAPIGELQRLLSLHRLFLNKPSQPPRVLNEQDIGWLQTTLHRLGDLEIPATGRGNKATERALENLFGTENLEERWLGGPSIDPIAWDYLRSRFDSNS